VADTLRQLRAEGLKLGIISNAQAPYFRACLGELGLESLVDHSECHDELPPGAGTGKPVLLERALRALETAPHQTMMVGDRHDDVAAGHQLGCVKVGMSYGFGDPAELVEANVVIDRFAELPAAILRLGFEIP